MAVPYSLVQYSPAQMLSDCTGIGKGLQIATGLSGLLLDVGGSG